MKNYFIVYVLVIISINVNLFAECIGNCIDGKGRYDFGTSVYDGEWKNRTQNGKGTIKWSDGTTYTGFWVNGEHDGEGTIKWSNGTSYSGNWKRGIKVGYGKIIYSNGTYYEGEWRNNLKHGLGKYFSKKGTIIYDGYWEEDEFLSKLSPLEAVKAGIKTERYKNLTLVGKDKFLKQIKSALSLLEKKTPNDSKFVYDYVVRIQQFDRSGMRVQSKIMDLADRTTFHSLEWITSVLVHEACHSNLYHEYLKKYPNSSVPIKVHSSPEAEIKCNKVQAEVGKKIGMKKSDIDYLLNADGKHADIDGDGDSDWDDYNLRDW
jgi:hypothetical protein